MLIALPGRYGMLVGWEHKTDIRWGILMTLRNEKCGCATSDGAGAL